MNTQRGVKGMSNRASSLRGKPSIEALEARSLLSITLTNPAGPITSLTVGGDGSFQVNHTGFTNGQIFYPNSSPADAGIFIRQPDGLVDGLLTTGNSAAASTRSRQLHSMSQVESTDGQSVVSVADNSTDGSNNHFQLTQVVTYHPGDEFFKTDNTILNQNSTPLTLDVFAAADIFLADSDKGVGFRDAPTGAVGGTDVTGKYHIFIQPDGNLVPTNYTEDFFNNVWTTIGTPGAHFNNTVLKPLNPTPPFQGDPNYIDNGAGLEWKAVTIQPGETATISYFWSFGAATTVPPDTGELVATANIIHAVEGTPFSGAVGSFTSTSASAVPGDFSASILWGDGTTSSGTIASVLGSGFTISGGHTYAHSGSFPLSITVQDNAQHTATSNGAATVADAPLTVAVQSFSTHPGDNFSGTIATFTDANPGAVAQDFSATILWGDGATTAGTVASQSSNGATVFSVTGAHVYAQPTTALPTTLPIGVIVQDVGGAMGAAQGVVTLLPTATPPPGPVTVNVTVTGGLAPTSDSGPSNSDGVTNVKTPTFEGLATPGAFITVSAQSSTSSAPISLGMVQAGGNGQWTLTAAAPLADGSYSIVASGALIGGPVTTTTLHPLVIDTVGPRVTGLTFNPSRGQVMVTFQDDRSGMDALSLANPKFYSFSRQPGRMIIPYNISNISAVPATGASNSVPVMVTISGGVKIGHGRRFIFTVASGGVRDAAGNGLDGAFNGAFPSGIGRSGLFAARLVSTGGHSLAPLSLALPFSVLHAPKVKATKK
jgi:Bacterial Ig-like domain